MATFIQTLNEDSFSSGERRNRDPGVPLWAISCSCLPASPPGTYPYLVNNSSCIWRHYLHDREPAASLWKHSLQPGGFPHRPLDLSILLPCRSSLKHILITKIHFSRAIDLRGPFQARGKGWFREERTGMIKFVSLCLYPLFIYAQKRGCLVQISKTCQRHFPFIGRRWWCIQDEVWTSKHPDFKPSSATS